MTTIGDLPRPRTKGEYVFLIIELVMGLFLLATVLGHVANIVTNVSAARKEFQGKPSLDTHEINEMYIKAQSMTIQADIHIMMILFLGSHQIKD